MSSTQPANPSSSSTANIVNDDDLARAEVFDDTKSLAWGWRSFKPKWLQWLNSPNWFLFFVCWFTFIQGTLVSSFVNISLPTLEKRFKLTSKETGFIVSSNDITAVILVVFVSFFGSYGHKTKWLGCGSILTGFAGLLYALPKLLIGKYQPIEASSGSSLLCLPNATRTDLDCNTESSSFNVYYFIFVASQLIAGAGTTPLFSLGPAYLDENVNPKVVSWYLAGFYTSYFLGPGLGSLIAGKLVSIYTDLVMPTGLNLTPRDPRWIGAWWLGPCCGGFILILDGLILLGFPAKLPGSEVVRKEAMENGYLKKDKIPESRGDFKSLLRNTKDLLTNWTFVFTNFGVVCSAMIGISTGPFFFKFLTERYGATPFEAGLGITAMMLPGTALGIIVGSFIVKKLGVRDSCRKAAKVTFLLQFLGIGISSLFLIPGCTYVQYAGADVGYFNSSLAKISLLDQCNAACQCSISKFRPLCGPDGVSYFSPCFAGCTTQTSNKGFTNCSCANPFINKTTMAKSDAVLVGRSCKRCSRRNLYLFVIGCFVTIFLGFLNMIPMKIVTLRSVSENQRALGLGIQFVFLRLLASVPGPVITGTVIDETCTLWSTKCGSRGNCLNYDYTRTGWMIFFIGIPPAVLAVTCYGFAWFFVKDSVETKNNNQQLAMEEKQIPKTK